MYHLHIIAKNVNIEGKSLKHKMNKSKPTEEALENTTLNFLLF